MVLVGAIAVLPVFLLAGYVAFGLWLGPPEFCILALGVAVYAGIVVQARRSEPLGPNPTAISVGATANMSDNLILPLTTERKVAPILLSVSLATLAIALALLFRSMNEGLRENWGLAAAIALVAAASLWICFYPYFRKNESLVVEGSELRLQLFERTLWKVQRDALHSITLDQYARRGKTAAVIRMPERGFAKKVPVASPLFGEVEGSNEFLSGLRSRGFPVLGRIELT